MYKSRIAAAAFITYLLFLFYLTFISPVYNSVRSINIVPLKSIILFLGSSDRLILRNIVGNIAAFAPMGMILPILGRKLDRLWVVITLSGGLSIFIEIMQYILKRRVSDIDDVILNIIGGMCGYSLYALYARASGRHNSN